MPTLARSPARTQFLTPSMEPSPSSRKNDQDIAAYYLSMNHMEFKNNKIIADCIRKSLGPTDCETGILYMLWGSNRAHVKIGYSRHSGGHRTAQICRSCGQELTHSSETSAFPGAYKAERILHTMLLSSRHIRADCSCGKANREWYHEKLQLLMSTVRTVELWMKKEPYDLKSDTKTLKPEWLNALWEWEKSLLTREPIEIQTFFDDGPDIVATGQLPMTQSLRNALAVRERHYFGLQKTTSLHNGDPTTQPPKESSALVDLQSMSNPEIENLLLEDPEEFLDQDFDDRESTSTDKDKLGTLQHVESVRKGSNTIPKQERSSVSVDLEKLKSGSGLNSIMMRLQRSFALLSTSFNGQREANKPKLISPAEQSENDGSNTFTGDQIRNPFDSTVPMLTSNEAHAGLDLINDAANKGESHINSTKSMEDIDFRLAAVRIPGQWPEVIEEINRGEESPIVTSKAVHNADVSRPETCITHVTDRSARIPSQSMIDDSNLAFRTPNTANHRSMDSNVDIQSTGFLSSRRGRGKTGSVDHNEADPLEDAPGSPRIAVQRADSPNVPTQLTTGSLKVPDSHDPENCIFCPPKKRTPLLPGEMLGSSRSTNQTLFTGKKPSQTSAIERSLDPIHALEDSAPKTTSKPKKDYKSPPQAWDPSVYVFEQGNTVNRPQTLAPAIFSFPFQKNQQPMFEFTFRKAHQQNCSWQVPAARIIDSGSQETVHPTQKGLWERQDLFPAQIHTQNIGPQQKQSGCVNASPQLENTDAWSRFIARSSAREVKDAPSMKPPESLTPLANPEVSQSASQATKLVPGKKHILNGRSVRIRLPP